MVGEEGWRQKPGAAAGDMGSYVYLYLIGCEGSCP